MHYGGEAISPNDTEIASGKEQERPRNDITPYMIDIRELIPPVLLSCLVSLLLGRPALLLAKYFNLMDIPNSAPHKKHALPMPLAGGLLMTASLFLLVWFFRQRVGAPILAVLAGAVVIFLFGLWDDRKGLSAFPKLAGQLIAGIILITYGVQVNFMGTLPIADMFSPYTIHLLNMIVTLFWIVGITNAINLVDSMDGMVAGLGIIASVCFVGAARLSHQNSLAIFAAIFLGIMMGLYYWNKMPAKFFLGDSGSQLTGFLLAAMGIMYNPLDLHPESSWIVPIMLLSVPIFDTTLVIFSRINRGQPIYNGRRDHTYHRLIARGVSPAYSVVVIHLVSILASCLAFIIMNLQPLSAILTFGSIILCSILLLIWFERIPTLDERENSEES